LLENNIKKYREEKNFTQLKLAALAEMSPSDLNQVENSKKHPFPKWRKKISKALGRSEKEVFPNIV
jgi:transcriptional regulator with XRE-family HTH domain